MENIVIKRKSFTILEQIGERSFKAERNGKFFYVKKYEGDKEGFHQFLKSSHRFSITAINVPKLYYYDKNSYIVVLQYIEGDNIFDMLIEKDLPENIYEAIFYMNFLAKREKMALDYRPEFFKFDGKKLYYLPFAYLDYNGKDRFANEDIKLWFYTKDFINYLKEKNLPYDESRLGNEYAKNKEMALMAVKYYS